MKNQTIFCLGITDYGKDIPLGKDHLMETYAEYNHVVMFNLSGSRTPTIKRGYDRKRLVRKVCSWFIFPKTINNIIVVYPIRFPFIGSKYFDIINNLILYQYLRYYKYKYHSKAPIIFSLTSFYSKAIKNIKPKKVIYYVSDEYGMFTGNKEKIFNEYEVDFIPQCDGVITVSKVLYNNKKKYNSNTIMIYNATNPNRFIGDNFTKPSDMKNLTGKIVGCIGKFDDWYDLEFVDELAQLNVNINFVFVGPIARNIDNIKSENIFFLGQKEYNDIPNYIYYFDVCIIPYKNIERIKTVDMPLKLLDYLAAGKPVVAKNINEIENTKQLYSICNDLNQFNSTLIDCLGPNDVSAKNKRIKYAKNNSWFMRAKEIGEWIKD